MPGKILLIEGDEAERQSMAEALRVAGFAVSTAKDGPTGVKLLKNNPPDVVISNLVLGEMTAVDVCEKIRNLPAGRSIGIILVSNSTRSKKYMDGIQTKYKVHRFLKKPIPPASLLEAVQTIGTEDGSGSASLGEDPGDISISQSLQNAFAADEPGSGSRSVKEPSARYFPGLLFQLSERMATGILILKKDGEEKKVSLSKGKPVAVESRIKGETLGQVLVEKGVLAEKDYLEATRVMVENGTQLGEAIVSLGFLDQATLDELVHEHQIIKIANCFLWLDAELRFEAKSPLPSSQNICEVTIEEVFRIGLERLRKVKNLAEILEPLGDEFLVLEPHADQFLSMAAQSQAERDLVKRLGKAFRVRELRNEAVDWTLAACYVSGLVVTGAPNVESLLERIDGMSDEFNHLRKEADRASSMDARVRELNEAKTSTEREASARSKEKQDLEKKVTSLTKETETQKGDLAKARNELEELKPLKKKAAELEKTLADIRRADEKKAEEITQLKQQVENLSNLRQQSQAVFGGAAVATPAFASDPTKPPENPFGDGGAQLEGMESLADAVGRVSRTPGAESAIDLDLSADAMGGGLPLSDSTPPASQPRSEASSEPAADSIFDLSGDLEAGFGSPSSQTSPEQTIFMAVPGAGPQATEPAPPDDIFGMAGDLSAFGGPEDGLSSLEPGAPVPSLESTIVAAPPMESPEDVGAMFASTPKAADANLLGADLDSDLDAAFDAQLTGQSEAHEGANGSAAEESPALPADPFAPSEVRQEDGGGSDLETSDLEDFFSVPK